MVSGRGPGQRRRVTPIRVLLGLAFVLASATLSCNLWPLVGQVNFFDPQDVYEFAGEGTQDGTSAGAPGTGAGGQDESESALVQGALDALQAEGVAGGGLPGQGTLIGDCRDEGVILWDQERCNERFDYSYQVVVDFASGTFTVDYHAGCEMSSPGLFGPANLSETQVQMTLSEGSVLPDGRLFGRANQVSATASWVEGQAVPPLSPASTVELLVVGFVDPAEPFLALAMCTEDSLEGGGEAILASGWNRGLNPCAGVPSWAISCQVLPDG